MKITKVTLPFWKRATIHLFRAFIAAGILFMCFEVGIWLHPPLMAWGLGVIDPKLICTSAEALRGARQHARIYEGSRRIEGQSKIIQSDDKYSLWRTPSGNWWVPNGSEGSVLGFAVQQQQKIYGDGEWAVQRGDIVLDCGANIGVYTREALNRGAKLVIAIEPAPVNVECLRRNFRKEIADGRVIVAAVGVWDKEDSLPLYEDPLNSGADSFVIKGPSDKVAANIPLTTIDKLAKDYRLDQVNVIKMDIKGATAKALFGAKGTLASRPRLAISTEELEDNPAEIRSTVLALQPSYRMACGVCSVSNLRVNPDVLLFRP
jgi:FkbM family methyltransferase